MIAQHVKQRHRANGRGEQIRSLRNGNTSKQSTVAAALNSQVRGVGPFIRNQPFGAGVEVVKNILLAAKHAGLMPTLAVLAAAAQVGHGIDAARLNPRNYGGVKARFQTHVKAAISVQKRGAGASGGQTFLAHHEQRNHGSIFAGHTHALNHELRKINRNGGLPPHGKCWL